MFDAILALTAIARSAIECSGIAFANKQMDKRVPDNAYDASGLYYDSLEEKNRVMVLDDLSTVKSETPSQRMNREHIEREAAKRVAARHANDSNKPRENPMADWVMNNDRMLLEVLKPGVHLIPNNVMEGMDADEIAKWLFAKIEAVESVEHVTDGLEVTVR
ncbi:hypothetical protein [Butyrivibrio sp. AC2005]|uniref:hypothetical protein n=1 Tax=Butyrivibrio sp. AC2005 TaxID=1280672 RepID=UPI0003FEA1D4|nr:hypothetical protein [Butyrivibrio sp. AC2005]